VSFFFQRDRYFLHTRRQLTILTLSPIPSPTLPSYYRAYESSRMYRELKLRSAIFRPEDKSLVLLPRERTFSQVSCWNLASESGSLGEAFVTSQRLTWRASFAENFNVSIPFMVMERVAIRASPKFGSTLVVTTSEKSGGLLFGFRVDPPERLITLEKELIALREAALAAPEFGVSVIIEVTDESGGGGGVSNTTTSAVIPTHDNIEDSIVNDMSGDHGSGGDAYAAYLAEGPKEGDRTVIFSTELGLAVESPPPGMTLAQLWVAL
jgi:Bardet-Biedl syndrome 5 protein